MSFVIRTIYVIGLAGILMVPFLFLMQSVVLRVM